MRPNFCSANKMLVRPTSAWLAFLHNDELAIAKGIVRKAPRPRFLMEIGMIDATDEAAEWRISDPDLVLVKASVGGDSAAFGMLVRRHSDRLLRVALQVTHSLDDAQEVVQEAFFNVHQKLSQFRGTSKFSTWLIRIVLNESLSVLRKGKTCSLREVPLEWSGPVGDSLPMQISDWHPNPEQHYLQSELREILRTGLSGLRPILRVVFVLRDIEGLSIAETAEILKLSSNVVKVRLHRARVELRHTLSTYFRRPTLASRDANRDRTWSAGHRSSNSSYLIGKRASLIEEASAI
jgi:RNA polymerase sigma-70 factor (ECF subfamily)